MQMCTGNEGFAKLTVLDDRSVRVLNVTRREADEASSVSTRKSTVPFDGGLAGTHLLSVQATKYCNQDMQPC